MSLAQGTKLGSYEIVAPLGAGGMGEVYRARDTKLSREVAIKVLPDLFALDPDRRARFEREAQTLAALNHPNIAAIYGVEGNALVMELVEGEDLSTSIARGAVPLREALPIAKQIAEALDAAHELGIVHRDLKPANIKVRVDGTVKVLDFGLAKAMDPPGASGANAMQSPTLTARATQMGVVLGTAAYMAPEQARGRVVDKRADIWAFGVVLFEMLAGRRPFDGDDITGMMARVLERDPEWNRLPAATPPALRALLERCLAKEPKARLRDVGEARHAIEEIAAGRSGSLPIVRTTRTAQWIPWSVAVIAVVAAAAIGWLRPAAGPDSTRLPTRVELSLPENVEFYTSPRISADGRRVAFIGVRDGGRMVFVRELDQAVARPIAGTDGSIFVAFNPDGRSIAIISADARLKRLSLDSGAIEDLTTGVDIVGGLNWSSDGTLLYGGVTKILAIPAAGGMPREIVAAAAGEATIASPAATPDGRTVLFTSWTGSVGSQRPRIEAVPITGGARRVVVENAGYAVTTMPGRLLFQRNGSI